MSNDRAGGDMTDAEELRIRNKRLKDKGATSRYIDSKPDGDFTFETDQHGTELGEAPDEVPAHLVARANAMEEATLADLTHRGLRHGEHDSCTVTTAPSEPPTAARARLVIEMLAQQRALGYGYEKYEAELADLMLEHFPESRRGDCIAGHRLHGDSETGPWCHVHKDEAETCPDASE